MNKGQAEVKKERRSMIEDVLDLCVQNHLITNAEVAALLQIPLRTVRALRSSDSFQTILERRIEKTHGVAIRAVRMNSLVAANTALETAKTIMKDPAAIGSMKLEAAKVALESYHRAEDRNAPKSPLGHPQTNVAINLTFAELAEAQDRSRNYGASLELEASDVSHTPQIAKQGGDVFPSITERRAGVREESK
jgi:hypothetical protein